MTRRMRGMILAGAVILATASGAAAQAPPAGTAPAPASGDQARFDAALAALAPQRPGVVDAYVISAALWDDHVFQSEATGAADVMRQRFDAQGRTLVLTNGEGDGQYPYPRSNPANLAAAIKKVSEVMDPKEDVLVLFLTSHGSHDGAIALKDRDMQAGMYPAELKGLLDATPAERRLVIVSSCYSGGFAPALAAPQTIVFTAAAADRSSFGCDSKRDWTYFGDAFFNQSLRRNRGLLQAFEEAKAIIQVEEQNGRLTPSRPAESVGDNTAAIVAAAEHPFTP